MIAVGYLICCTKTIRMVRKYYLMVCELLFWLYVFYYRRLAFSLTPLSFRLLIILNKTKIPTLSSHFEFNNNIIIVNWLVLSLWPVFYCEHFLM
jgi:hypothetical protein